MTRKRQAKIYAIAETRRLAICELKRRHPHINGAEIGKLLGISRERVRQILSKAGLPTRALVQRGFCLQCGKRLPQGNWKYCGRECQHNYILTPIVCSTCGTLFWISKKGKEHREMKYGRELFYCSRQCWGRYAGKHYGFHRKEAKDVGT